MANHRYVQKEAYAMIGETCPHVDAALARAGDAIKEQTVALRDALFEALGRAMDAEEKVADLEREVESLKRALEEAREQVSA